MRTVSSDFLLLKKLIVVQLLTIFFSWSLKCHCRIQNISAERMYGPSITTKFISIYWLLHVSASVTCHQTSSQLIPILNKICAIHVLVIYFFKIKINISPSTMICCNYLHTAEVKIHLKYQW